MKRFKKTVVVNLFGGAGIGKSTCAADLFAEMKHRKIECELVREYVKRWAWDGRKPGRYDQFYITAKQIHEESAVYGKVGFIVTDSPILLGPFYESYYGKTDVVIHSVLRFLDLARRDGVEHKNFVLTRHKEYNPHGRFQTEKEARKIDRKVAEFLKKTGQDFTVVTVPDRDRPDEILRLLGVTGEPKRRQIR